MRIHTAQKITRLSNPSQNALAINSSDVNAIIPAVPPPLFIANDEQMKMYFDLKSSSTPTTMKAVLDTHPIMKSSSEAIKIPKLRTRNPTFHPTRPDTLGSTTLLNASILENPPNPLKFTQPQPIPFKPTRKRAHSNTDHNSPEYKRHHGEDSFSEPGSSTEESGAEEQNSGRDPSDLEDMYEDP